MNATAAAVASETPTPTIPAPALVSAPEPAAASAHDAEEARVENAVFRDAMAGALIGVVVCVPMWILIAVLALHGAGTALWPPVAMAAGVGVFAGVFFGGWAGTLVGGTRLEHFERATRTPAPPAATR